MKKILQLTTYPIDNPDHGGKLRCHNIRKSLEKEFEIKTLSFDVKEKASINNFSVILSNKIFNDVVESNLFFDWGINNYLENNLELKKTIFNSVKEYSPDIIIVEQGFLWPLVKEMEKNSTINKNVFIIYSSHNIEYQMKKEIYSTIFKNHELEKYVNIVKEIEYDMIKNADLILGVSDYDVNYIKKLVPNKNVYLYKNGHNGIIKTNLKEKWKEEFKISKRNWVYVASWHGPNIKGLYNLITNGLLEKDEKDVSLWVFGGVGAGMIYDYNISIPENSSIKLIGPSSEEDIDSAIISSMGIILPIWEGGGSNLKTAQALLSGKKIVASDFAFRGFETYKNESEVYIDNNASKLVDFISNLEDSQEMIKRSDSINELKWGNILSTLSKNINKHYGEKA
jgi:hypothetical protein